MPRETKYDIKLSRGNGMINFLLKDFQTLAYTEDEDKLWEIISAQSWTIQLKDGEPRYLYSNSCKKTLHQMVIDYYFGEEVRRKAYENDLIIEHLNNNGLDCQISNLYFLHDIKNKYKGQYFDKETEKALTFFALRVFHIIRNHTFQITIGFTVNANLSINGSIDNSKPIESMKFLYRNIEYWNVIQDAETMLDELLQKNKLSLNNLIYRYADHRIYYGKYTTVTAEEAKQGLMPGHIIWRNGRPGIVMGDPSKIQINSVPYDEDWN